MRVIAEDQDRDRAGGRVPTGVRGESATASEQTETWDGSAGPCWTCCCVRLAPGAVGIQKILKVTKI